MGKKIGAMLCIIALLTLTAACNDEDTTEAGEPEVLTGVGNGYGGEIEAEVEGDEILNVVITEHSESEGIADPAFDRVPDAIVEAQTTEVDTVSGATETSEGIIEAVEDALN